jgi:hypothetical protein
MSAPSPVTEYPVQKTVFDLDTFEEVTISKTYSFVPVTSVQEALAKVDNDHAKLLAVVNEGLRTEVLRAARANKEGWLVEDEDGKTEPFTGTVADTKRVNSLVLTLAKLQGFAKDIGVDKKRAIKDSVKETIKNTPALRTMLAGAVSTTADSE